MKGIDIKSGKGETSIKIGFSFTDGLNKAKFQVSAIGTAGFVFLCFLYAAAMQAIDGLKRGSGMTDLLWMELALGAMIALCCFWAAAKIRKAGKQEELGFKAAGGRLSLSNATLGKKNEYDLADIGRAWLYHETLNGITLFMHVKAAPTSGAGIMGIEIPMILETGNRKRIVYRALLKFMAENYPWISIGFEKGGLTERAARD